MLLFLWEAGRLPWGRWLGLLAVCLPLWLLLRDRRSTPPGEARALLFTLLGAIVYLGVTVPRPPIAAQMAREGVSFQMRAQAALLLRYSYLMETQTATSPLITDSAEHLRRQGLKVFGEQPPNSVTDARTARLRALLEASLGRLPAARQAIAAATPPLSDAEQDVWSTLLADHPPAAEQVAALADRVAGLHLGWQGDIALYQFYRRTGHDAAALAQRIGSSALTAVMPALIAVGLILVLFVAALALAIVGISLWAMGRLKPLPTSWRPMSPPLLEGVVLMLFLGHTPLAGVLNQALLPLVGGNDAGKVAAALVAGAGVEALALAYVILRLRATGVTLKEIGLTRERFWVSIGCGVAGWIVVFPLVIGAALISVRLAARFAPQAAPPSHPVINVFAEPGAGWLIGLVIVGGALVAPFFEELFFRGMLYGGIRRRWGVWPALLLSSAVFAGLHPQGVIGFLPLFTLAAAFCLLYEWRKSLLPGMAAHALNNGLIFVFLLLIIPSLN